VRQHETHARFDGCRAPRALTRETTRTVFKMQYAHEPRAIQVRSSTRTSPQPDTRQQLLLLLFDNSVPRFALAHNKYKKYSTSIRSLLNSISISLVARFKSTQVIQVESTRCKMKSPIHVAVLNSELDNSVTRQYTVPRRNNARRSTAPSSTLLYAIAFEFEFVYLIYNQVPVPYTAQD
jgi:hypothetical protein